MLHSCDAGGQTIIQQCRMGLFFGRVDSSGLTPSKEPVALVEATHRLPETIERIYASYHHSAMPRENIGDISAKTFAE